MLKQNEEQNKTNISNTTNTTNNSNNSNNSNTNNTNTNNIYQKEQRRNIVDVRNIKKEIKRNIKDTVFSDLFSIPKYKLQLYQTLHPEDKDIKEEDLKIISLKNVICNGVVNDYSLNVRDKMITFCEAQSTWSNMILWRMILYFIDTMNAYFIENDISLFHSTNKEIPVPEFYVIYTGDRKCEEEISLKETFYKNKKDVPINIKIKILALSDSYDIINQYIKFTKIADKNIKIKGNEKKVIVETIEECISKNILKDYLKEKEREVLRIMLSSLTQETATMMEKKYSYNEGKEDAIIQLFKSGAVSIVDAAKALNMTQEEFKELVR